MASVNKVIIVGNLGKDPEIRYSKDGVAIANISLATTFHWKDKNGQKRENVEWHKVVFYRNLAEIVGEYLKKGRSVYVEGRLRTRSWEDNGVTRYSTEIIADQMQMLDGGQNQQDTNKATERSKEEHSRPNEYARQSAGSTRRNSQSAAPSSSSFDGEDDDIPF